MATLATLTNLAAKKTVKEIEAEIDIAWWRIYRLDIVYTKMHAWDNHQIVDKSFSNRSERDDVDLQVPERNK